MPEYDAFGREIGADPLAGLREPAPKPEPVASPKPEPAASPKPEPVAWPDPEPVVADEAAPEPFAPPQPPPRFVRPGYRPRWGLVRLVVVLVVLGLAGLFAASVGQRIESGIDAIVEAPESAPPPTGVAGRSLIRRANFADAVAALKRADLGRPLTIRVAPDRIDATLVGKRLHQVQITPGGRLRELGPATAAPRGARTIPYAAIDPTAPERLTRAGATRKHPARSIDYLVLIDGTPVTWGAYYKGGRIVLGDAHGRKQRVL